MHMILITLYYIYIYHQLLEVPATMVVYFFLHGHFADLRPLGNEGGGWRWRSPWLKMIPPLRRATERLLKVILQKYDKI